MGNRAFGNKIYEEAISYYTKAIENSPEGEDELHVYYSNSKLNPTILYLGAAAYFELADYEKALTDATESVKLKSDFLKGYIRKAKAERELLMNDQALETAAKALELEPDNEPARELFEECKAEWDDDHTVSEENPEKQRFARLEKWLSEGGSKYDKLKIRFYNPIYRGVHAAKKIRVSY